MSSRPDDAGRRGQIVRESARLFRENCLHGEGNYVKDLGVLNRDMAKVCVTVYDCV